MKSDVFLKEVEDGIWRDSSWQTLSVLPSARYGHKTNEALTISAAWLALKRPTSSCLPFLDSDQVYHFCYQGDIHHSLPDSTFEELDLDIYREAPQVVIDDLYIEKDPELSLVPPAPPLPLSIEELDPEVEEFLASVLVEPASTGSDTDKHLPPPPPLEHLRPSKRPKLTEGLKGGARIFKAAFAASLRPL